MKAKKHEKKERDGRKKEPKSTEQARRQLHHCGDAKRQSLVLMFTAGELRESCLALKRARRCTATLGECIARRLSRGSMNISMFHREAELLARPMPACASSPSVLQLPTDKLHFHCQSLPERQGTGRHKEMRQPDELTPQWQSGNVTSCSYH